MNRARAALLLTLLAGTTVACSRAATTGRPGPTFIPRQVALFVVDGVSFESVMAVPAFRDLANEGGAGLMTTQARSEDGRASQYLTVLNGAADSAADDNLFIDLLMSRGVRVCRVEAGPPTPPAGCPDPLASTLLLVDTRGAPSLADDDLTAATTVAESARAWLSSRSGPALLMMVSPSPSHQMDLVGDEVTPLLEVFDAPDSHIHGSLTSDSTGVNGLVSNVDVAPTILQFFGISIPSEMEGHPIRVTGAGPPLALHLLHLDQRRIRIPFQVGEAIFVTLVGLALFGALIVIGRGKRLSPAALAVLRFLLLCAAALYLVDLAAGLLPRLTYVLVVPFAVLCTVGLAWAALAARWPGPVGPFAFLGAAGLAFVVVDAVFFGGRAFRVPLTGGTMFDGVRFYGLPNVFIALLLAGSIFVATRFEPFAGFALIFAVGLFAGFPRLGANVGASITLFAGAGLWWVFRTRPRFRVKEVALVGGVVVVGLASVLLANRYLPGSPTHATRFVERSANSLSAAVSTFRHRLGTAFHLLNAQPEGYVPMVVLFVVLWLAIARPEPIRSGFELAGEPWRWAIVAIVLASLVGFLVNDTGTTAAAPGLVYAATGLAYPAFVWAASRE